MEYPFYVRVKFGGNYKIISLDWENINFETFKKACKSKRNSNFSYIHLSKFTRDFIYSFSVIDNFKIKIPSGQNLCLQLSDHKGAPIPINDFVGIVKTFHASDFDLVVEYTSNVFVHKPKIVKPIVIICNLNCVEKVG